MRIGIDVGGTKIEGALLDGADRFVVRRRIPTPAGDYDALCAVVARLARDIEAQAGTPCSIGIAMPGTITPGSGRVKNSNTVCLNGRTLLADLEGRLGRPLRAENDANCLVLSEVVDGAAAGAASAFGVIVGTGTGGGLYANGALVRGPNGIAGEWGHNPVPWPIAADASRPCYCGRADCVETWLSGAGLVATCRAAGPARLTTVEGIVNAAAAGNAQANMALATYATQFARALATVINIFDPEVVVLGGGLSNLPGLSDRVARELPRFVFSDSVATRVVPARFGDSSGVRGAAWLWNETPRPAGRRRKTGDV